MSHVHASTSALLCVGSCGHSAGEDKGRHGPAILGQKHEAFSFATTPLGVCGLSTRRASGPAEPRQTSGSHRVSSEPVGALENY